MDTDSNISKSSIVTSGASDGLWAQESSIEAHKPSLSSFIRSHLESLFVLSPSLRAFSLYTDQTFDGDLGEGGSFEVHSKTIEKDGQSIVVAMKRLKSSSRRGLSLSRYETNPSFLRPMLRDSVVMEIMENSPFILDLHDVGCWLDPKLGSAPFLLIELSTSGTLTKFLSTRRKLLIIDIAMGVLALHKQGIFHTDLKSDNVLIFGSPESRYRAKISDFGSSVVRNTVAPDNASAFGRDMPGTRGYMAPELGALSFSQILSLSDSELRKLDAFSFAALLAEAVSSCRVTGFPFNKNIAMTSVEHLSFMRDHIGLEEWENVALEVFHKCLLPASSRCDNFVEILTSLGENEQDILVSTQTPPSLAGVTTSKFLAFLDQMNRYLPTSEGNFDIEWYFKNSPIFAFEMLAGLRHFGSGLNDLESFQEKLFKWIAVVPEDTGEYHLVTSLSHIFGCVAIDFEKCCENLLEAARREYLPAQMIYRRVHEALFSIYSVEEDGVIVESTYSPLAIKDISPKVFSQLESLENAYPENYLAQLIRFTERWYWSVVVHSKICEEIKEEPGDVDLLASWDAADYNSVPNECAQNFVHVQTKTLITRNLAPETVTDNDLALLSLLVAAAIIFGDAESSELGVLCDTLRKFKISPSFYFTLLGEEEDLTPLMLACRVGNASAVRILCKTGCIEDLGMNRLKYGGGAIPLHFLFTFQDTDVSEMCGLLSRDVIPEDTYCSEFYPTTQFCLLMGTPLDFSLKVGSEAATRNLWHQVYSEKQDFLKTISLFPGVEADETLGLIIYEMTSLDTVAVKFLSSMNPSIWEYFLSCLTEEAKNTMIKSFREKLITPMESEADSDRGYYYFQTAFNIANTSQITLMLLHGPKYTERLICQMCHGLKFFMDPSSPNFAPFLYGIVIMIPEAHYSVALVEAYKGLATSPDALEIDQLKAIVFSHSTKAEIPGTNTGHSLGFIMAKSQPVLQIFDALLAAAMSDDIPAFRRIVQKASTYRINLVEEGSIQFLGAKFAQECPPRAQQCLRMIYEMDVPNSIHWLIRLLPRTFFLTSLESRYTETGQVLWDAVKNNNLSLILLLVDQDPAILYPRFIHPSIFYLLCVNDIHLPVLKGLLESLGPSRSLELLRKPSKVTGMTALDVAIYYRSQQCLLHIARFLTAGGFSIEDCFPAALLNSLQDYARGRKFVHELVLFWERPMSILFRPYKSDEEDGIEEEIIGPRLFTLVHFVLEMSRNEPARSESIMSILQEYFNDTYDPVLFSDVSNRDEDPEENPGALAGNFRVYSFLGKIVRHWKLLFAVAGLLTSVSVAISRVILRKFFFGEA